MSEETLVDPVRRQVIRFDGDGMLLRAEVTVAPGGDVPAHRHPHLEERFEVLEGRVRFRVGWRRIAAGPGTQLTVAHGVTHAFKNVGGTEARLRIEAEPGLGLRPFLEEAAALARAGRYTRLGIPRGFRALRELCDLLYRHRDTTRMALAPMWLVRLLAGRAR
jgi:quercetin dioxygenase-like cupin family protein